LLLNQKFTSYSGKEKIMGEHCSSNFHEHSHEHEHKSCSCGCTPKIHSHEEGCNCAEKFLALADDAWKEVLKEKIKAKIIAKKGEHIEKLAEIIACANGERWKHIISAKTKCNEFKSNLKDYFSSCE
jgi:ribulose kinase